MTGDQREIQAIMDAHRAKGVRKTKNVNMDVSAYVFTDRAVAELCRDAINQAGVYRATLTDRKVRAQNLSVPICILTLTYKGILSPDCKGGS